MALPTKYREQLTEVCGGQIILTVDPDGCLALYPVAEWEKVELQIGKLPSMHPLSKKLKRTLVAHATDMEWDSQGRILIPPELREYAAIGKAAVMVGQMHKFEIWDEAHWNQQQEQWKKEELLLEGSEATEAMQNLVF